MILNIYIYLFTAYSNSKMHEYGFREYWSLDPTSLPFSIISAIGKGPFFDWNDFFF